MPTLPTPQVPTVVGIKRASPHAATLPPLKMVNITYPTPPTCSRPILPPPAHYSRSLPYPNQYQL
ncbi:hypothetical protein CONCODRAFT_80852 [Conidiobolus coronatus NRRL 28638]|uniref:Uncharacterized protein n=1 Tax=Conidiobolus coronatus (strain ATCC 28846 / CBS 209.66 / NRRL 28638) TaxID=796925 RepID=A0A137NQX2_CONC2|nr:hypothetical protein CONCODRAFT_80852 [Conidiobolus coronatus NRRL 28638]|eukprot:KXN65166.1 hypothetical protein CONCODRAFT_80852 [Conidiobolus coronatus NRRL 28638]